MGIGAVPINAFGTQIDEPISAVTGSEWENIDGVEENLVDALEETKDISQANEKVARKSDEEPMAEEKALASIETKDEKVDEPKLKESIMDENKAEELSWSISFAKSLDELAMMPTVFSLANDSASGIQNDRLNFGSNEDEYIWLGQKGNGIYIGLIDRTTYNGRDAFCGEFNGNPAGGNYDDGYVEDNPRIKKILACYDKSAKTDEDYMAAQIYIWAELLGKNVATWGTSGANSELLDIPSNPDELTCRVLRNIDAKHTQNIIVYDVYKDDMALKIIKKNADGTSTLSGARFKVEGPNGFLKTGLETDLNGEINVNIFEVGQYRVTETKAPAGYKLSSPSSRDLTISKSNTKSNPAAIEFRNDRDITVDGEDPNIKVETHEKTETTVEQAKRYEYSDAIGQLTIRKQDSDGNSLDNALFNILVEFSDGSYLLEENWEVDNGARLFTYTHPKDNHDPAKLTITEVKPPLNYEGESTPKIVTISPTYTRVTHITSWTITITTTTTNTTIIDAEGEVVDRSTSTATARTKSEPQVEEFSDFIAGDREITVTFVNSRQTGDIVVTKRDANTGLALKGAEIHLWGEDLGSPKQIDKTLVTDEKGEAVFDNLPPGTYAFREIKAPYGYNLNDEIQNAVLQSNEVIQKEIRNYRKDGLTIKKVDENGNALPGATFELRRGSGEVLLREVTNENGIIYRGNLLDDTYVIEEIKSPEGYTLDENPIQSICISKEDDNKEYIVTFVNKKKPSIEITKIDGLDSMVKLEGAVFRITDTRTNNYWDVTTDSNGIAKLSGLEIGTTYNIKETKAPKGYVNSLYNEDIVLRECRCHTVTVKNYANPSLTILKLDDETRKPLLGAKFKVSKANGELIDYFTTDVNGKISVPAIDEGTVIVTEISAPDGYVLDMTPHKVNLINGKPSTIEITNSAKPGLQIVKKDSLTGLPIKNARFDVTELKNGGQRLVGSYETSDNGAIFIPGLDEGTYMVTETKSAPGYILDSSPKYIEVKAGRFNSLELFNTPYSDLRIVKIDSETRKGLAEAVFKLYDKDRHEIGTYETSSLGEIIVKAIPSGTVFIQEVKAPKGYVLDNTVKKVELEAGKTTTAEIKNSPLGSLVVKKLDAKTKKALYGAKFNLYDSKNNILGEFTTDQNGMIYFGSSLKSGTYKLKETKAPAGYVLDETIRTVKVNSNKTTEIVVENEPMTGKIQIVKVTSEDNYITGDKKGDGLKDAVFEIYDESLNIVDRITTNEKGIAISKELPLGKYAVKEIEAPMYYLNDSSTMYAQLKVSGDLVRFKVLNSPEKLDVSISKAGPLETMSGEEITYKLSNIANNSNCQLKSFYWRDFIPTDSLRVKSIKTGTYSERGSYSLYIRTNKCGFYQIKSDLQTNINYEIDLSKKALNLKPDEYVTDVKLDFGTVGKDFKSVENPEIKTFVKEGLANNYRIVNRADVGGRTNEKWVYSQDRWVTLIYNGKKPKLPQTGGPSFFEDYPEYLKEAKI